MANDLEKKMNPVERFAFKITKFNALNPWISIGVCHRKIVSSKKFEFEYSGKHGSYMISANGGSWSHLETDYNNKVKVLVFNI